MHWLGRCAFDRIDPALDPYQLHTLGRASLKHRKVTQSRRLAKIPASFLRRSASTCYAVVLNRATPNRLLFGSLLHGYGPGAGHRLPPSPISQTPEPPYHCTFPSISHACGYPAPTLQTASPGRVERRSCKAHAAKRTDPALPSKDACQCGERLYAYRHPLPPCE